jgi:hypothetical protein
VRLILAVVRRMPCFVVMWLLRSFVAMSYMPIYSPACTFLLQYNILRTAVY